MPFAATKAPDLLCSVTSTTKGHFYIAATHSSFLTENVMFAGMLPIFYYFSSHSSYPGFAVVWVGMQPGALCMHLTSTTVMWDSLCAVNTIGE